MKFCPVVTKLWLLTDGQKNGWMEGRTDGWLNVDQTISLRLRRGIISNEVMYWSTHSRKNQGGGLQFSGPQSSSMHYLVKFHKVIVVVILLCCFQPINILNINVLNLSLEHMKHTFLKRHPDVLKHSKNVIMA